MKPRVMNAVGFIGQFVSDNWEAAFGHGDLKDALMDQGFSTDEIADAFRWIEDYTLGGSVATRKKEQAATVKKGRRKKADPQTPNLKPSLRVLSQIELMKISPRAHGVLLSLYERGVMDLIQFEDIIERAMRTPGEQVSPREMKRLAALTLFNAIQTEWKDLMHSKSTLVH